MGKQLMNEKVKKAYAVYHYLDDDYKVMGVFSEKEYAEAYKESLEKISSYSYNIDIEGFILDAGVIEKKRGLNCYLAWAKTDGTAGAEEAKDYADITNYGIDVEETETGKELSVFLWAENEQDAINEVLSLSVAEFNTRLISVFQAAFGKCVVVERPHCG